MNRLSSERVARIANGTLLLASALATLFDPRAVWLVVFMGGSLIFSGTFDFCGFKILHRKFVTDDRAAAHPFADDSSTPDTRSA